MQSDSMSNGQDISLQGAYRQDQDAKLEVKPTLFEERSWGDWLYKAGAIGWVGFMLHCYTGWPKTG